MFEAVAFWDGFFILVRKKHSLSGEAVFCLYNNMCLAFFGFSDKNDDC